MGNLRTRALKGILRAVAALLVLVGGMALVGMRLPKGHVAQRSAVISRTPDEVWRDITDFEGQVSWRTGLRSVERLPDRSGRPVWLEIPESGDPLPLETTELDPPRRLVRSIADPDLPFGGRWIYDLVPVGEGTRLTITEEGEVYSVLFRFVSHFFVDLSAAIEAYLRDLGTHYGVALVIEPA